MKKRDWIAAAFILAAALVFLLIGRLFAKPAESLCITVDGEIYGTYPLDQNREIQIGETNICQILDGRVRMIQADCPDQICVHTAAISSEGGSIVCLPNRVVLTIRSEAAGSSEPAIDGISS